MDGCKALMPALRFLPIEYKNDLLCGTFVLSHFPTYRPAISVCLIPLRTVFPSNIDQPTGRGFLGILGVLCRYPVSQVKTYAEALKIPSMCPIHVFVKSFLVAFELTSGKDQAAGRKEYTDSNC